ncbi:MAG: heat-inducible transcriptional repressor HrcA [Deltaproteobacteria bacterium]|nr:heat-inducible transcriptional repressor HrcA [Deltaproteobacteria bacterium]
MVSFDNLSERKREVLKAVISDYIFTAEPVSSGAIAGKYLKGLSSATVRNVMAELEEMGFLLQPHTSAGRVPTDKAFRVYVDQLMELKSLPRQERDEVIRACSSPGHEVSDLIKDVSRILSIISHHTGLAIVPKITDTVLKHIEFVKLRGNQVRVVLISQAGIVQNRLVELEEGLKQADLDRMSSYLNQLLSGLTIKEIKMRLIEEMRNERNLYDRLLKKALRLGEEVLGRADSEAKEVFIEGRSSFFEYPEFLDVERMKEIFRAFEDKSRIVHLLDKSLKAEGIHIFIGCETGSSEFNGCSLIAASYGIEGNISGSLGVIGPIRMDYSRIIPLVDYTAKLVEKMLKEG